MSQHRRSQMHKKAEDNNRIKYNIACCKINILHKDTIALMENDCLSDSVIDAVLYCKKFPKTLVISSLLFGSLFLTPKVSTKRTFDNFAFSDYEYIIGAFLINNNHWLAVYIDLLNFSFTIIDPLGSKGYQSRFFPIWEDYYKNRADFIDRKWTSKFVDHPRQKDSVNCGVLVCVFLEHLIQLGTIDLLIDTGLPALSRQRHLMDRLLSNNAAI